MAEGGEKPKIVIDAHGTEKEVSPQGASSEDSQQKQEAPRVEPEAKSKPEEEKGSKGRGGVGSFVGGAVAGAVLEDVAEAVGRKAINEGRKFIKDKVWKRKEKASSGAREEDKGTEEYFDHQEKEIRESIGKRSFEDIQDDLIALTKVGNPDSQKVSQLKKEREGSLTVAKEIGVIDKLNDHLLQIQSTVDFGDARKQIARINIGPLEDECRALFGWDPKLEGILDEYRDVALINMDLALIRAQGGESSKQAKDLERQIEFRGWGLPPGNLERLAKEYLDSQTVASQASVGNNDAVVKELQGLRKDVREGPVSPEKQRQELLTYEEGGFAEIQIPPLTSNIWEGLSTQEKEFWQLRLQLSNARAKKQAAMGIDDLFPNPHIMGFTKESLQTLTNHGKVAEAIAIYSVFIMKPNLVEGMRDRLGMTTTRLIPVAPNTGVHDQTSLGVFRKELRGYLGRRFAISEVDSRDAEQVAYNFIVMTGLIEECDTQSNQKLLEVANGSLRDLMRPRSKLLGDIAGGKVWPPNVFGEWARNHAKRLVSHPNDVPITNNLLIGFMDQTMKDDVYNKGLGLLEGRSNKESLGWSGAMDKPFGIYYLTKLSKAILVLSAIVEGGIPKDKTPQDLQNAYRSLGTVGKRTRETIVWLLYNKEFNFLRAKNSEFEPDLNVFAWAGLRARINREFPGYFD